MLQPPVGTAFQVLALDQLTQIPKKSYYRHSLGLADFDNGGCAKGEIWPLQAQSWSWGFSLELRGVTHILFPSSKPLSSLEEQLSCCSPPSS